MAFDQEKELNHLRSLFGSILGVLFRAALVVGAAVRYFVKARSRVVAGIMAFGSGVLISALSFELMQEGFEEAGLAATATGFLLGASMYAAANRLLAVYAAKHRKRFGASSPAKRKTAAAAVQLRWVPCSTACRSPSRSG